MLEGMKQPLAIPLVLALCGAAFSGDDVGRCPAPPPTNDDCAPLGNCTNERYAKLIDDCPTRQDGQCIPNDWPCRFTCDFEVHGWAGDEVCIVKGSQSWPICQQGGQTKTLPGRPGTLATETFQLSE